MTTVNTIEPRSKPVDDEATLLDGDDVGRLIGLLFA